MATGHLSSFLRHLRRAALLRDGRTDGQLLECFVTGRDEAAFEALVRRHGPMVWGVCRRVLPNDADAEDAFQATFLVLARKAATVTDRAAVGNWLHGVARNAALQARTMNSRRIAKEQQWAQMPRPEPSDDVWQQLRPLLDNELSHLPDRYRLAIVLCDLEGRPVKEAARQLGCPQGTVASRLARGRAMLAQRLARHGLALSGGALASVLFHKAAWAGAPPPLVASTVKAAMLVAAGQAATAGVISARAAALTQGVLKAMFPTKLNLVTVLLLVLGALSAGVGVVAYHATAADPGVPQPAARDARAPEPAKTTAPAAAVLKDAKEAADAIEDKQDKAWTLQAVAEEQAKGGDKAAAARTYQDAIQAAKEIKDDPNDKRPPELRDSQVYHTIGWIAVSQAQTGDLKGGLETARAIESDSA